MAWSKWREVELAGGGERPASWSKYYADTAMLTIAKGGARMMKTCMEFVAGNVVRVAHGERFFGLRPVVGAPRNFWELVWIFGGSARQHFANGRMAGGKAPCLYVSHPDSCHGWTDDGGARSEVFVLHFRSVPAELQAVVKPAETFILPLTGAESRRHGRLLAEAAGLQEARDPGWRIKFEQILLEATLMVMRRAVPVVVAEGPVNRVKQAMRWFEENIGENPSLDDVAAAVGVTRGHLRRLFVEAGMNSPKVELARVQMAVAQRCLIAGWKVDKIAAYLGFSEASALSRSFSSVCGRSPRRWLAECPERARASELV